MKKISVVGARAHNLKNINAELPRDKVVVVTGVSGSGKSSLAFDTIFAEGQRRYVESLSTYARQFLQVMGKPDVDSIEGLSPTISIDQKTASHNPRSTVGTVTEIHDYMRLLYARVGEPHCPKHGIKLETQTVARIVDFLLARLSGRMLAVLAPLVIDRRGEHLEIFRDIAAKGFARARVDGRIYDLEDIPPLAKTVKHTVEIVADRLRPSAANRQRLVESVEVAAQFGNGRLHILEMDSADKSNGKAAGKDNFLVFSTRHACPKCGFAPPEMEPKLFSFNNPKSACPSCEGLGVKNEFDPALVAENPDLSLAAGAIRGWDRRNPYLFAMLKSVAAAFDIDLQKPFNRLPAKAQKIILYGSGGAPVKFSYATQSGKGAGENRVYQKTAPFEGVIPNMARRMRETDSPHVREELSRYAGMRPCAACGGRRLSPPALAVKVGGFGIHETSALPLDELAIFFDRLKLQPSQAAVAERVVREIRERVGFLVNVGLEYLSLERAANTLSSGEAQRIRLASQVGSGLTGVTYVLDEPSIGLHQHDNGRLLRMLIRLRDLKNTVIIVEHDEEAILSADHVIDIGPLAGVRGGEVVAVGTPAAIARCAKSITGQYLSGARCIEVPAKRRRGGKKMRVLGARGNNLKGGDFSFLLGAFNCVTGVSGSGKSTLVRDILVRAMHRHLHGGGEEPLEHKSVTHLDESEKQVVVDQSPIGRTPRSNPATYTGFFTQIRDLFAGLPASRERGYAPGRFSFNVAGGRCENCEGDGLMRIEMHFLPDVFITCEACQGRRYNRETLEIRHRGKNIHDVLTLTVDEGLKFFANIPPIARRLQTLQDVGLGYIQLGQPATTLSGGEAQRVKLSLELSKRGAGKTLYVLDEPTTGLHFYDVDLLLKTLHRLTDEGNTIVVIEHNLDVVKTADWILDLGPKGGNAGGTLVSCGAPEEVAADKKSLTGKYLRPLLARAKKRKAGK
ncbi:MAG: excinuclease ABC subunit UvrA [Gammaproteobacteria bacterium]